MLYQISVKYEGDSYIKSPFELNLEPFKISVVCDKNKIVNELIISKKLTDYEKYLPKLKTEEPHKHSLNITSGPDFEDIISLIQTIESLGSFWFRVKKIYWETPKRDWIPENDEERKRIQVTGIKFKQEYPKIPIELSPRLLTEMVILRDNYKHLIIPMAFYREGRNEFSSFRYVYAFINFYFYLEDLYGFGKTKNIQVEKQFIKSEQINRALNQTINSFSKRHQNNLKEFLRIENYQYDNIGIIKLIVKVRGNLHHFSQKSSKKKGHPLNQKDFETMAYLLFCICTYTFIELTAGILPK